MWLVVHAGDDSRSGARVISQKFVQRAGFENAKGYVAMTPKLNISDQRGAFYDPIKGAETAHTNGMSRLR
jgi:hypothetical protein